MQYFPFLLKSIYLQVLNIQPIFHFLHLFVIDTLLGCIWYIFTLQKQDTKLREELKKVKSSESQYVSIISVKQEQLTRILNMNFMKEWISLAWWLSAFKSWYHRLSSVLTVKQLTFHKLGLSAFKYQTV